MPVLFFFISNMSFFFTDIKKGNELKLKFVMGLECTDMMLSEAMMLPEESNLEVPYCIKK
jgi:hypothetical protein